MASVSKRLWTHNGVEKSAWVCRYKEGGKHRSKNFDKKKDADKFRQKMEALFNSGSEIVDSRITVAEVCELFMRHQELRTKDGRIGRTYYENLDGAIRVSVVPLLGSNTMTDLKALQVEEAYNSMIRRGLKPVSAMYRIGVMKSICAFAVKRGFARRNEAVEGAKSLRGIPKARIRIFTEAETQHLLKTVETRAKHQKYDSHLAMKIFVHLAAFCGLRSGEIRGLTTDSIDFGGCKLKIRHNLTRHKQLKAPKTEAGNRDIPLPAHISELLREWERRYFKLNALGLVFTMKNGEPFSASDFNHRWTRLLKRAGLHTPGDNLHFHALRHFAGSWMIKNHMPITDVAALLGHSKVDMTLSVYAHALTSMAVRRETFDRMSSALLLPNNIAAE